MGKGLIFGPAFGVALGFAIDNVGAGIALGIGVGVGIGALIDALEQGKIRHRWPVYIFVSVIVSIMTLAIALRAIDYIAGLLFSTN